MNTTSLSILPTKKRKSKAAESFNYYSLIEYKAINGHRALGEYSGKP